MASLWLDEASVMHEDVMLYGTPVLRHKGRMGPLLMTFTPRGRRHWSCTTFFDVVDEALIPRDDRALVHATTRDNPFAPAQYYDSMRSLYSSGLAAQELAGEFVDLEGLMFLREWFAGKYVDVAPLNALYARYWDKAGTVAQDNPSASYSAGVLMCRTPDGLVYVVNVVRGQWSYLQRDKVMSQVAADDKERYGNVLIYVEQEPGSGGKESAQQTVRRLAMYPVYIDIVSGQKVRKSAHERLPGEAKVVRAAPLAAQCEAGNVHIVRGGWNTEYIEELTAFPEYAFSDQVDASSGAYNRLAKATGITMEGIERLESPMTGDGKWGVQLVRPSRRRNRVGRM
jgi:predicted phage terminase large subunit-like protein